MPGDEKQPMELPNVAPPEEMAGVPAPAPPAEAPTRFPKKQLLWVKVYFTEEATTFYTALVPMCFLSMILFTRWIRTNFIFDEQEALLANPYVRSVADPTSKLHWVDAFHRDFWGLLPDRSIGSYRPLPDLVWRLLWFLGARDQSPFLHHWVNVLIHGINGALMVVLATKLTKERQIAWLTGAAFTASAVLTEAVSGVVGLADVLGALGAILALLSLFLPLYAMPWAVFAATLVGLYSKESALCVVPLVPFAALFLSQVTHPKRPLRWVRMLVALAATAAAFVLYVEARRRMFQSPDPPEYAKALHEGKGLGDRTFAAVLRWYHQPSLPKDPLNNPLVEAPNMSLRVGGALRVWFRGLMQVIFPLTLSGDYSAPQEPVPASPWFFESIVGLLAMTVPWLLAPILGLRSWWRLKKARAANPEYDAASDPWPLMVVSMIWVIVSYFPVSNIPILLPTVRAERFWYFPVIGASMILAVAFSRLLRWAKTFPGHWRWAGVAFVTAFFLFQSFSARRHANDYTDDLTFWDATRKAVPRSAKAHLNYSVMQGARGNLEERRRANAVALELAPNWPMASIYLGDTLCRMHRAVEAWPYYKRGFELAPNDPNLIALALQCLWDEKVLIGNISAELSELGPRYPSSWLDFLQRDTIDNGTKNNGVDPKYRPRGYNEGPKGD